MVAPAAVRGRVGCARAAGNQRLVDVAERVLSHPFTIRL